MNPFGTSDNRFEYQKKSEGRDHITVDMNNGMISVKDKEIMEKRYAFQKTIELHKRMQDMRPNAIFQSKVKKLSQSPSAFKEASQYSAHD